MDEPLDRGVGRFIQRVKSQLRMVGHHARPRWHKLPKDRIAARVRPVDPAERVGPIAIEDARKTCISFVSKHGIRVLRLAASGSSTAHT